MEITLYHSPRSRSMRVLWLLEEIGAAYTLAPISLAKGEHKGAEYMGVNPFGMVPTIKHGDNVIYESGAICLYLADHFNKCAPAQESPERGKYLQWIFFAATTLEAPVLSYFLNTKFLPEERRNPVAAEAAKKQFSELLGVLDSELAQKNFVLGGFSAADIMLGSILNWSKDLGLLAPFSGANDYVNGLVARPAFQAMLRQSL